MRQRYKFMFLAIAILLVGCSDNNNDTVAGDGAIRALHAISDLGPVNFLIEETTLANLNFKEATGVNEFDDLEYEFSFEVLLPDDSEFTEILSQTLDVNSETEYFFVLAGSFATPELFLWEQFGRNWAEEIDEAEDNDTEVTVMEVSFGHVSSELGSIDIYLESPGTSPLSANPVGTIGYSEFLTATELDAGEYQLVLTPEGDASTILFASDPLDIAAATSNLFAFLDDGGLTTADFSVRWIGSGLGLELADLETEAVFSTVHAAFGSSPVDVIGDGDFANPLASNLAFGERSPETTVDKGILNLIVTPAGDPGVFLAQRTSDLSAGTYNRLHLVGLPGDLQAVVLGYDKRKLATHARAQLFQGAVRFQTLDAYLVDSTTDISLIGPGYSSFLYGTRSGYSQREPGDYVLVLTETGTKNVIGGPLEMQLEAGRVYDFVIVDASDITAAEILVFEEGND